MNTILNVKNLSVNFNTTQGIIKAVDNISFSIEKGDCLGIAGESGSGKTQTFFSLTGILSDNGTAKGIAEFDNVDLLKLNEKQLSKIRGKKIGFIFQDPMTSLTPHMNIENQLIEVSMTHDKNNKNDALKKSKEVLDIVKLPRIEILLNKTREEIARDYVTKQELKDDMNTLMDRVEKLHEKVDKLFEVK